MSFQIQRFVSSLFSSSLFSIFGSNESEKLRESLDSLALAVESEERDRTSSEETTRFLQSLDEARQARDEISTAVESDIGIRADTGKRTLALVQRLPRPPRDPEEPVLYAIQGMKEALSALEEAQVRCEELKRENKQTLDSLKAVQWSYSNLQTAHGELRKFSSDLEFQLEKVLGEKANVFATLGDANSQLSEVKRERDSMRLELQKSEDRASKWRGVAIVIAIVAIVAVVL